MKSGIQEEYKGWTIRLDVIEITEAEPPVFICKTVIESRTPNGTPITLGRMRTETQVVDFAVRSFETAEEARNDARLEAKLRIDAYPERPQ